MRNRGFRRARAAVALVTTMLTITAMAATASADIADSANNLLLPRDCSLVATTPRILSSNVESTARTTCSSHRDKIITEVCTQYRQPLAAEDVTWQQQGLCGVGQTPSSGGTSSTARVQNTCVPGTWTYRSVATAEIHKGNDVVQNGTGLDISGSTTITCPLLPPEAL